MCGNKTIHWLVHSITVLSFMLPQTTGTYGRWHWHFSDFNSWYKHLISSPEQAHKGHDSCRSYVLRNMWHSLSQPFYLQKTRLLITHYWYLVFTHSGHLGSAYRTKSCLSSNRQNHSTYQYSFVISQMVLSTNFSLGLPSTRKRH